MKTRTWIIVSAIIVMITIVVTLIVNNGSLNTMSTESANYDGTKSRIEFKKGEKLVSPLNDWDGVEIVLRDTMFKTLPKQLVELGPGTKCIAVAKKSDDSILVRVSDISISQDAIISHKDICVNRDELIRLNHSDNWVQIYQPYDDIPLAEFGYYIALPGDMFFVSAKTYQKMVANVKALDDKITREKIETEQRLKQEAEANRRLEEQKRKQAADDSTLQLWIRQQLKK